MEDYDLIELTYVLDEEPSSDIFETLINAFPEYGRRDRGPREYGIRASKIDEYTNEVDIVGGREEILQTISTYPEWSVEVLLSHDDLTIVRSKSELGLLSDLSKPNLQFSTWIYAMKDSDDHGSPPEVKKMRKEFVEVLAQAANILEPKWGFGRRGGLAIGEDETIEDLATRTKPPLYEYNVFRPETVEAIGREQVLSAPAYYVEELDSGGVFMAVTEPPKQCGHEGQQCEEVADQLGLSLAKTERYH